MRGKECPHSLPAVGGRITPAYAGKRVDFELWIFLGKDHPRLCGEKFSGTLTPKTDSGSPPPMRGKVITRDDEETVMRITPAYAGKSNFLRINQKYNGDHPRLCGEKS